MEKLTCRQRKAQCDRCRGIIRLSRGAAERGMPFCGSLGCGGRYRLEGAEGSALPKAAFVRAMGPAVHELVLVAQDGAERVLGTFIRPPVYLWAPPTHAPRVFFAGEQPQVQALVAAGAISKSHLFHLGLLSNQEVKIG